MKYQSELDFLIDFFKNVQLNVQLITKDFTNWESSDLSLRKILGLEYKYENSIHFFRNIARPNCLYRITDAFFCSYYFMLLPDSDPNTGLLIGPYLNQDIPSVVLMEQIEKYKISPSMYSELQKLFSLVPVTIDKPMITTLIHTFAEHIWEGSENYAYETIEELPDEVMIRQLHNSFQEPSSISMEALELRYAKENELLQAVIQGIPHKAEAIFASMIGIPYEQRTTDILRNHKNYTVILNTLLRKAAEQGAVHPYHIDKISSDFARKIEHCTSTKACSQIQREMIRKYTLLVRNHSMKEYSFIIQKVLTYIDSDISADLSLHALSVHQNVNPSYLSNLFKKETGTTLTDYVNRKRVDYAILLLNSTSLQIQSIAQYCGIPDVNYFTKIFKKYIGKTPKDYRKGIRSVEEH